MTESYSPNEVMFKYYTSGAEVPTNFRLMPYKRILTAKQIDNEIRKWMTEMPKAATFNIVVNMIHLVN